MSLARAHCHAAPYAIVTATEDMVRHICTHLRALDVAEVAATNAIHPQDVPASIMADWRQSDEVCALLRGDSPLCLFGATKHAEFDAAFLWMIATEDIKAKELVRYGKCVIAQYMAQYACLFCLVWAKHAVSMAWLRRLGFQEGSVVMLHDTTFILMIKERGM